MMFDKKFDIDCAACPRLVDFLSQVSQQYPNYHAAPVAPFGDPSASLLVVGLAPGMHGANATGRPFTGDDSGVLLYQTLYKYGFSSAPESRSSDDGLVLKNCRITNVVKCLPPQNKPVASEVAMCSGYLANELASLPDSAVIVALGSIAHQGVLRALGLKQKAYLFGHENLHGLERGQFLLDSYHCSRYNTQTKRLTEPMFESVFEKAKRLLAGGRCS